ncbi:unnamed protein product, partial [Ixodes persulcatus]
WKAESGAVAAVVGVPGWRSTWEPSPRSSWRPRTKSDPGGRRCSPIPPTATPVGPSVATWTSQEGTEPPRLYVSRKPWGDERRPETGQAGKSLDVPVTVTEQHTEG